MLYFRKIICLISLMLFLVQPVFAETLPSTAPRPDIVSAVHNVPELPSNWSPLSPETPQQQFLLKLTSTPVYFLSEAGVWQPVLAQALPEDVTSAYAGSYGIPADSQGGYAYRIALNADACWEDGVAITADDYIFSIGKLLEDEENRSNWTFLANAEAVLSEKKHPGEEIISLRNAQLFTVRDAKAAGYTDLYVDTGRFWGLDTGWMPITSRTRLQDFAMPDGMDERFVSPAYLYNRYLADGAESCRFQSSFIGVREPSSKTMTMEDLGIIKVNPLELILLLQEPLAPSAFMQKLEHLFLLRKDCWGKEFATSPQTYSSYGPYRITESASHQIILKPNPNWWGSPVTTDYDRIICRAGGKD